MSAFLAIGIVAITYIIIKFLHLTSPSTAPSIFVQNSSSTFVQSVLSMCPILRQPYTPPLLWGKSGHIQTFAYAKMGRVKKPVPQGVRHSVVMPDGSTQTFDLYEPHSTDKTEGSCCLLFCPGIGNSSESSYIRTLVNFAQKNGYISIVLNHLGALKTLPLTAHRMYTYGGTEELGAVVKELQRLHPSCAIILVGCSMGGNIVIKYLGEDRAHQENIIAAMSICTGYDLNKAMPLLLSWKNMARGYIYVMTANQKNIIRCHKKQLLTDQMKQELALDEEKVFASRLLCDLDESYTRRRFGFDNLEDFYRYNSASHYLPNIKIPLLMVNSEDDPLVPVSLLEIPKEAARKMKNCMFILTKHGGHLGFYEQGIVRPKSLTWMDRLIVEFADAVIEMHRGKTLPSTSISCFPSGEGESKERENKAKVGKGNLPILGTTNIM